MSAFHKILANNLVQNVTNFTVWFALVFWAFLETRSVFVTGMIGGVYLVMTAGFAFWFGSVVDHHYKKRVMLASSAVSFALYAASLAALALVPEGALARVAGAELWLFVLLVMTGVIAGNLRMIALPTLVTALIEEDKRDKANGLVGMVTGIGFVMTSAVSGFLVAWGGMEATLWFALALSAVAFVHMSAMHFEEPPPAAAGPTGRKEVDLRGTIRLISAVPGLIALILFACFNNALGGVFMALMDAYGLSLLEVQEWGLLWALASCGFIASGFVISKTGLGANPLRTLLLVNMAVWSVAAVFTLRSSVTMLAVACVVWLFLSPFAEASEQTTLQKVVPFERQGRVFGFAQSVEQAASPLTSFMVGPLTQFVVIPFMTTGAGARAIGEWYGTGPDRGMALVFSAAGVLGVLMAVLAFNSRQYRELSAAYANAPSTEPESQSAQ